MEVVSVILAHHEEIVRDGLAKLLTPHKIVRVVDLCYTINELLESITKYQPDVIILDDDFSDTFATADIVTRIIKIEPKTGILVLTHSCAGCDFYAGLTAGVRGYVSSNIKIEPLIRAVLLAADGEWVIAPGVASRLVDEFERTKTHVHLPTLNESGLTDREKQALLLLAQGLSNKDIAEKLIISEHTVKVHVRKIMEKLKVHTRGQAAFLATRKYNLQDNS